MNEIREFAKRHDIQAHLYAAVDDLSNSDWSIFEGLQEGEATVDVVWDGVQVHFRRHLPVTIETSNYIPRESIVSVESVEPKPEETQPQDHYKPRRKREQ